MSQFFNQNKEELIKNFKTEVLDHVANEPHADDPAVQRTMFAVYVDNEENNFADNYQNIQDKMALPEPEFNVAMPEIDISATQAENDEYLAGKYMQVPEAYVPPRGEVPEVPEIVSISTSKPDLSYREQPAPEYFPAGTNMSAFELGKEWLFGRGPQHRHFPSGSTISNQMAKSVGAEEMQKYAINEYFNKIPKQGEFMDDYVFNFGVSDAMRDADNPASQFIGSWHNGYAVANGNNVDFTVYNKTGLRSLLYGNKVNKATDRDFIPDYYGVPTGTKSQTITWSVPRTYFEK